MEIKETFELLLQDKTASWAIVLIAYLIVTLIIRRFTFSQLKVAVKTMDRKVYKKAKRGYFRDSLTGWLFYLISAVLLMGYWFSCSLMWLKKVPELAYFGGIFLFFLFSLISHMRAFFFATVHSFHERIEKDEFELRRLNQDESNFS